MIGQYVTAEWHDGRQFLASVDEKYGVAVICRPEKEKSGLPAGLEENLCDQTRQRYHRTESPQPKF